jgi:DNA-directed RNA polymerase II subunit RPB2
MASKQQNTVRVGTKRPREESCEVVPSKRQTKPRYDPSKPVPVTPLCTMPAQQRDCEDSPWTELGRDEYRTVSQFIERYGLFRHHFDTYEHFISEGIKTIIDDESDLVALDADGNGFIMNFTAVNVRPPYKMVGGRAMPLFPNEVRRNNDSYFANVYADVTVRDARTGNVLDHVENRVVCKIPVMVGSSICNLYGMTEEQRVQAGELLGDQGGYFLVCGNDRVLTSQVKRLYNGSVMFQSANRWICEIRSMNAETGKSVLVQVTTDKVFDKRVVVIVGGVTYCMIEIFDKLGVTENLEQYIGEDIAKFCSLEARAQRVHLDELVEVARASPFRKTRVMTIVNSVLAGKRSIDSSVNTLKIVTATQAAVDAGHSGEDIVFAVRWGLSVAPVGSVTSTMLPHIGIHGSNEARAQCLGRMVRKLGQAHAGVVNVDDRGDYANKRLETAGTLINDLFKMLWKQFLADVKQAGYQTWPATSLGIERDFKRCFTNGFWGAKNSTFKLTGVVEAMTVKASSQIQTGIMRKVKIYVNHDNKNRKIRELHPSTVFTLCISETVEGQDVGTRLGLAMCAFVSRAQNTIMVKRLVGHALGKSPTVQRMQQGAYAVTVNGALVAYTLDVAAVHERLLQLRKRGALASDTSISMDITSSYLDVWCDAGRLVRPVYDMNVATPEAVDTASSIDELEAKGVVVMRDLLELSTEPIVLIRPETLRQYPDARYCELHPSAMYGVLAGGIVYVNHTQSPRACYMTCMVRHSMGTRIALGPFAPQSYTLNMPQKPLVTTRIAQMSGNDESPNGVNAIVALMCYSGFNQEDSVIINKSSLERGLFSSTIQRTVTVETVPRTGMTEEIVLPPASLRTHPDAAYRNLGPDGLPLIGAYIEKGDVIVGRVAKYNANDRLVETSAVAKLHEDGLVKMIMYSKPTNRNGRIRGAEIIKIVLVETGPRPSPGDKHVSPVATLPDIEIGDKVCSSMAQKGTCGMLVRQEDMPFTADGMVPDLIINSLCITSRMTINQIMASLAGKVGAVAGKRFDGSPFQRSVDPYGDACRGLQALGFSPTGTEVMYSGATGRKFKSAVFMGPVYYHRLTQLVRSAHFASVPNGMKNRITRQPLNGRINDGGLRVGEMEKDTLLAHGAVHFQIEKMLKLSDEFTVNICTGCNSDALVYRDADGEYHCRARLGAEGTCGGKGVVVPARMPAATKQLFHLTEAMNIAVQTKV